MSPGRAAAAPGRMTTGLTEPSSPKNGIGTGRCAQMAASASPPRADPVNPAAAIAGCFSSRTPASTPNTTAKVPAGAPTPASAWATIRAVSSDVRGCPSWALTTTGQPAASAEAVSLPATENANGKFDAANTATGPMGRFTRRRPGTPSPPGLTTASAYPPSARTAAKWRSCPVARATSPVSLAVPSAVSVSAAATSSSAAPSRAEATASSAAARPAGPACSHGTQAAAAASAMASTWAPSVSGTGSPAGCPVRGSYPWIIAAILVSAASVLRRCAACVAATRPAARPAPRPSLQVIGIVGRQAELAAQVGEHGVGGIGLPVLGDDLGGKVLRVVLGLVPQRPGLGQADPPAPGVLRNPVGHPEARVGHGQAGIEQPPGVVGGKPGGQRPRAPRLP